jgi:DNA polymerase elongation subunit (family B)
VKKIQLEVLNCLAKARSLDEVPEYLPEINDILTQAKRDLRNGHVPLEELVVTQSLSRVVEGYTSPTPAARAAMQLQAAGREVAPGQFMRFIYSRDETGVCAWDLNEETNPKMVDIERYCTLLDRAVGTVLSPFEKESPILQLL